MRLKEVVELQREAPRIFANKIVRLQGDVFHNLKIPSFGIKAKGKHDYILVVYIENKYDFKKEFYKKAIDSIAQLASKHIEVKAVGKIILQGNPINSGRFRQRPPLIGASISNVNSVTSGTLGCYVQKLEQPGLFIMSNNHILARCNNAKIGEAIIQPGKVHEGDPANDVIGVLNDFVELQASVSNMVNQVDVAVAKVDENIIREEDLLQIPEFDKNLRGLFQVEKESGFDIYPSGLKVAKFGSASGLTRGTVEAFNIETISIPFPGDLGECAFQGLISIQNETEGEMFSIPGDSGSLIFTEAFHERSSS